MPEDELVQACCDWAAAEGHGAVVVFDGRAPEGDGGVGCEVVGTRSESADDWLARRAHELADAGEPFWLVTSDRELRARAGDGAERTIGGGGFLDLLGLR